MTAPLSYEPRPLPIGKKDGTLPFHAPTLPNNLHLVRDQLVRRDDDPLLLGRLHGDRDVGGGHDLAAHAIDFDDLPWLESTAAVEPGEDARQHVTGSDAIADGRRSQDGPEDEHEVVADDGSVHAGLVEGRERDEGQQQVERKASDEPAVAQVHRAGGAPDEIPHETGNVVAHHKNDDGTMRRSAQRRTPPVARRIASAHPRRGCPPPANSFL